jgi:hypothetical protein
MFFTTWNIRFVDKKCVFNFCPASVSNQGKTIFCFLPLKLPTTQNLYFLDLSKKWNVNKISNLTCCMNKKICGKFKSIIRESFYKKHFFYRINFDFSISKQNHARFCAHARYWKLAVLSEGAGCKFLSKQDCYLHLKFTDLLKNWMSFGFWNHGLEIILDSKLGYYY